MQSISNLITEYYEFCLKEKIQPVYLTDIDKTAITVRAARKIGEYLLKDTKEIKPLMYGILGAAETAVYTYLLKDETKGLKTFIKTALKAEIDEKTIKEYSKKVVHDHINPAWTSFLDEAQKIYEDIYKAKGLDKPKLIIKTTGLETVATALKEYLSDKKYLFEISTIGNKYNREPLFITEDIQPEMIEELLKSQATDIENIIIIDDRYWKGGNNPGGFIASDLSSGKVEKYMKSQSEKSDMHIAHLEARKTKRK